MNFVDIIFVLVIVLAMARGWSRGLLATAATYIAPILGFMIAADWSDPVRDRLAVTIEAPDIALDLLAPLAVFIFVVAVIRFLAAILARLLGVGRSLPGRVLGAAASGYVLALLIGAAVVMVDEVSPLGGRAAREGGTQPPEPGTDPLADLIVDVDRQLHESVLAPPLASMASAAMRKLSGKGENVPLIIPEEIEAAKDKATEAAADAVFGTPAAAPANPAPVPDQPADAPGQPPTAPNKLPTAPGKPPAASKSSDGVPNR